MFISKLWREGFLPNMLKHEDVDTTESGLYSIGIVRKVIGGTYDTTYRIAGNFGEVFNLANWRFYGRSPNLKSAIFYFDEI